VSHELSLACYRYAIEHRLPHARYGDLEILLDRLDLRSDAPPAPSYPPRFDFPYRPPNLVEDDEDVVAIIREALTGWGYPESAIRTYSNGEQLQSDLATHPISIAVVDIKLSDGEGLLASRYISGIEVLTAIKAVSPGSRVILASGFGTAGMVNEAILERGASYYISKPFKASELLTVIQGCIDLLLGDDITRSVRESGHHSGTGESVLIADDDPTLAETLSHALAGLGYKTRAATNGLAALDLLTRDSFDTVILDLRMPGLGGLDLLARIGNVRTPPIPFVLTAVGDEALAAEATRAGTRDFSLNLPIFRSSISLWSMRSPTTEGPNVTKCPEMRPFCLCRKG
tara:strand:- start:4028 stop:5059 length:1032 start_codon:yes stop_codon:yes gene_type:complete